MSDKMTPMPIDQLAEWIFQEYRKNKTVFGVHHPYHPDSKKVRYFLNGRLETPIGPAAGPHTQLAQNLAAAYYAGGRFFELKTVQILDGEELASCIAKPCIEAVDEGYNVEWSTELYVTEALNEYIKAWFIISIMAKEMELGSMDGFQFNMSVGYDLKGIQSEKIDRFIEALKDARDTGEFKRCKAYFLDHVEEFQHIDREDIERISSHICNSVTLSTLHGCPSEEIQRIAEYLMKEKGLHTFVKCNPTLLGYEFVRKTMDDMGYGYLAFDEFHFKDDLQYKDAVEMIQGLIITGKEQGVEFGVKLTNTFPVGIKRGELPGEEMYMSGKPLFLLSFALAEKLARDFDGGLKMSYSGGADVHNIKDIVRTGIWPVTVATTLLKPGGYQRLTQLAEETEQIFGEFGWVDYEKAAQTAKTALDDPYYKKKKNKNVPVKCKEKVPLLNCFHAPCEEECPIHQDVMQYMELVKRERYEEALQVIAEKNPLPFITGTICYHRCMNKCMRNHYESAVNIRKAKLIAAEKGFAAFRELLTSGSISNALVSDKKTAIIGGGPAGLSVAYFLAREGMKTTLFEQRKQLGGALKFAMSEDKIPGTVIDQDVELIKAAGRHIEFKMETEVQSIKELKELGFDYVVAAVGAYRTELPLKRHQGEFLKDNDIKMIDKRQVETNHTGVYVIGDLLQGPSSVAETIRDARIAADKILDRESAKVSENSEARNPTGIKDNHLEKETAQIYQSRGIIQAEPKADEADTRCLHCATICEVCAEVCPNRANVVIEVPGMKKHQILHMDAMCNECGNCRSFCPYDSAPYLDKFTLFQRETDMESSKNDGFVVVDQEENICKVRFNNDIFNWPGDEAAQALPEGLDELLRTICEKYSYLCKISESR